jgi:murein DD-endopeptidase MepM/ murein hydrolase activator NlpD
VSKQQQLTDFIRKRTDAIGKVVDFDASRDRLLQLDFTSANTELTPEAIADTARFSNWVNQKLAQNSCRYGIGGYMENRTLYARSKHFGTNGPEPRSLHLGIDIWGPAGTPVYSPLDGTVHSFQNNNNFGDYGPTIILQHELPDLNIYSLYGHLNLASLERLVAGMPVTKNQQIAELGAADENGSWPPHLHFQLMFDMQGQVGDYPGVCRYSERKVWQQNIPDPDVLLQFSKATII